MTTIFDCCDDCGATLTHAEKAACVRFGQELCDDCAAGHAAANPPAGSAPYTSGRARTLDGSPLVPGVNVDKLDIAAGMRELQAIGYTEAHTGMVIQYALQRWARGEEEQAERGAIDRSFHGIDLTCWRRVLAAAMAGAAAKAGA